MDCTATTKAGKPCPNRVVKGLETCFAHSERATEQRKQATLASAEARKERVEARKEASEAALLSLTDAIRRDAAKERDALSASLITAAKADGNGAAMRELLNRVDGKVTDSLNLNAGNPFEMSESALHAWLKEDSESPKEPDTAPTENL